MNWDIWAHCFVGGILPASRSVFCADIAGGFFPKNGDRVKEQPSL